ncbi:hypothetical protein [Phormidesmis priestleyi]|nr:hypothetical protein [Phormidesmis priestleyi]
MNKDISIALQLQNSVETFHRNASTASGKPAVCPIHSTIQK